MACLLVLVIAATVLTAPPGTTLTNAARTTSPEAFWRATLPDAPMPESIRELLRPREEVNAPNANADVRDDDPPPPMNFNYDDYRASPSPRNHQVATAARSLEHAGARNAATDAASPAVFFLEEVVRVGGSLPFPRAARNAESAAAPAAGQPPLELYTVLAVRAVEGSSFVVCRREAAAGGERDAAVYGCRATGPATRAYAASVAGETGDMVAAAVVCRTDGYDASRWGEPAARAAVRLLGVNHKHGGAAAGVCHAVLDAQVLPAKEDESASAA